MRVLFFMRSINYSRHFESMVRLMAQYGHEVHIAFDFEKKRALESVALLEDISQENDGRVTWEVAPEPGRPEWSDLAGELRTGIDWLRYLEPRYASSEGLRRRATERAPAWIRAAAGTPVFDGDRGRQRLDGVLRRMELALPPRPEIEAYIKERDPHLVLVSPLVGFGSPQGDYLRGARALGIPNALIVASWDNLTNKGLIRDHPDLTVVWNEAQRLEATELHGLRSETILLTGAHTYDHWFGWKPSTSREDFCRRVGLRPDHPFLLYVGSSSFIAPEEAAFVERWLAALRASDHPHLREAGVLIRPHPTNARMWQRWDPTVEGEVVVFPREGGSPTDLQRKADYYDSIHHSRAVVGINTSAMIESAIVGRGVYTVLDPEFEETQEGTLHFAHLSEGPRGGVLSIARDMEEHFGQLEEAIVAPESHEERARFFVRNFVRPLGLETPGAEVAVEALEQLAAVGERTPCPQPPSATLLRGTMAPVAHGAPRVKRLSKWLGVRPGKRQVRPRSTLDGLRILFVLDHPGLLIHFDETIVGLADEGHTCILAFRRMDKFPQGLEALEGHPRIVRGKKPVSRQDAYTGIARQLRVLADYVHFLDPSLKQAEYSRAKLRDADGYPRPAFFLKWFDTLPSPVAKRCLAAISALEEAIPSEIATEHRIAKASPDLVVVSPLVLRDGYQTDQVKSARKLQIPSAVCVASWDNLSSKGLMRVMPDRVIVWNETQRREAVEMHGVPLERTVTTGAQQFDRWFGREPASARTEFCRAVGLPDDRPYALFVGSTRQKLNKHQEINFARAWIEALRASEDELVRDLQVLIRPHPVTTDLWQDVDFSDLGDVAVWRRDDALPVKADERAAYFDSLFHSAAVFGINSSAMIEAAIIGRPVHTVRRPEFHDLQRALMHYHYLLEEEGGFLREAADLTEHTRLLGEDLRDPGPVLARQQRFVADFIRPHGVDGSAQPLLQKAILEAAQVDPRDGEIGRGARAMGRAVLVPLVAQDRARVLAMRTVARRGNTVGKVLKRRGARLRRGGRPRLADAVEQLSEATLAGSRMARRRLKSQGEPMPSAPKPVKETPPAKEAPVAKEAVAEKAPPVKEPPAVDEKVGKNGAVGPVVLDEAGATPVERPAGPRSPTRVILDTTPGGGNGNHAPARSAPEVLLDLEPGAPDGPGAGG